VHAGGCSLYCMLRQPSTGPHPLPASGGVHGQRGRRKVAISCVSDGSL
jgi:hypothetical protein